MMNRRQFILSGIGTLMATAAGTGSYTRFFEPHWVELVRHDLDIAFLPKTLEGRKLVQISDLHIGPSVEDSYLSTVFEEIRRIEPDIVVITGDFISYRGDEQIEQLRGLSGNFPTGSRATIAVLGNHDYGPGWSNARIAHQVQRALEEKGVIVLRNEATDVDGLHIMGMDDLWAGNFIPGKALRKWDKTRPSLVICHNPDAVDLPGWEHYRGWILAGHTHGGQCKPPFLPPPVLPIRNRKYASGEVSLADGRRLYVNRGLGHLIPVRFNVRPEATVFRLGRVS